MNFRLLTKKLIPKNVFRIIEPTGHLIEAIFFNTINGFPSRGLKVIGVTGTNGKTTTCFMLHSILQEAGYKTGLMTTVAYGVGQDIHPQMHHMTTVSTPELMKRLKVMKKSGCDWVILETTSHALAQNRVWGIPYSVAVFTNLTHEHLAYHGTFERYRQAKMKLFTMTNKNSHGLQTGIVNADDPNSIYFQNSINKSLSYGIDQGDLRATDIKLSEKGLSYQASINNQNYSINCQIPGTFNVYNSLAAVLTSQIIGINRTAIEQGIASLKGVEGRMTRLEEGQKFEVIVDYAHSPDSFEKLFKDLRPVVKGRIIVVFGSLGGGDLTKRPLQGKLAGQYADTVIICEEDDRQEDGSKIMNEIAAGVKAANRILDDQLFLIHDRTEAINKAIEIAEAKDCVLLLGKGHEKTIEHQDGEHPWNEIETARSAIKRRLEQKS